MPVPSRASSKYNLHYWAKLSGNSETCQSQFPIGQDNVSKCLFEQQSKSQFMLKTEKCSKSTRMRSWNQTIFVYNMP